jgi:uncharacterized surface protein with fasciclin (FAS1) repeats|tara:strand:+ start:372 stop:533 length:162 start_codon:yes stop_codon:yes gene_type:complete
MACVFLYYALNGDKATVDAQNGVKINEANVVTVDVIASNGVIHVIDAVVIPAN